MKMWHRDFFQVDQNKRFHGLNSKVFHKFARRSESLNMYTISNAIEKKGWKEEIKRETNET